MNREFDRDSIAATPEGVKGETVQAPTVPEVADEARDDPRPKWVRLTSIGSGTVPLGEDDGIPF